MDPLTIGLVVAAGLLAGLASGLFGVGGGVLMVPAALYLIPGTGFHEAKAVSLLVIVFSAGIGIYTHWKKRSVDFTRGAILATTGFVGTAASVLFVERLADSTLRIAFGILMAAIGAYLAIKRQPRPAARSKTKERAALAGIGIASGLLSGAFGIGGGIVMVPAMILAGVGVHLAVGTSLVAVLGNSIAATGTHLQLGYGESLLAIGIPLAIGAIPGTRIGSILAHKLHAERLQALFGAFLVLMGIWMATDAVI